MAHRCRQRTRPLPAPLTFLCDERRTFTDLAHNVTQTTDAADDVITRTFDALNRMLTNADNDYKLEYEYAVIGLKSFVAKETQSYVGGSALSKTVTKTFDAVGNRVTEKACTSSRPARTSLATSAGNVLKSRSLSNIVRFERPRLVT